MNSAAPEISDRVRKISESEFILCGGTIEVRKGPIYLFNQSEREVPTRVFAGRAGSFETSSSNLRTAVTSAARSSF
jgi:hypothetical protein